MDVEQSFNRLNHALRKSKGYYPIWDKIERLNIEVTNKCNANCVFCFREEYKEVPKGGLLYEPTIEWIERIAKHSTYKRNRLKRINFGVTGEPLLNPDLVDFIKYARGFSDEVRISTNLMLLNERKSYELLEAGLNKICFSIDECEKERFEALRRKEVFETVYNNAVRFKEIRDQGNFKCDILLSPVLCNENRHRQFIIKRFWKKALSVDAEFSQEIPIGKIIDRVQPWYDPRDIPQCTNMVVIKSNGDICTCCFDVFNESPVGNIYHAESFNDILGSKELEVFRLNLLKLKDIPSYCKICVSLSQATKVKRVDNWNML